MEDPVVVEEVGGADALFQQVDIGAQREAGVATHPGFLSPETGVRIL